MNYWFTADYHLGHANIIKYCGRPFRDVVEMNQEIIRRHNERVKPGDVVFHVGDFCFKNSPGGKVGEGEGTRANAWESMLHGKIIHVAGNHDRNNSTRSVIQGMLIKYGGREIYLVHNPEHHNPAYKLNLVGHVHEKWLMKLVDATLLFNVGVDQHDFRPINIHEILRTISRGKTVE